MPIVNCPVASILICFFMVGLLCTSSASITGSLSHPAGGRPSHPILPASGSVRAYVFGGYGWLQRSLDFTGASTQGSLLQPTNSGVFGSGGNSGAFDVG